MSELRIDALSGETVIVAPVRNDRPHSEEPEGARRSNCPFCPGHESDTPQAVLELALKSGDSWFVRVFANLYPIVSSPMPGTPAESDPAIQPARGIHEVVVETPDHEQELAQRTPEELALVLAAYRERLRSLLATRGVRYVSVFRNKGPGAGASLEHPHSQLVALRHVPAGVTRLVQRWRRHYAQAGTCLLCSELQKERRQKERIVAEQDGWVLYVPAGAPLPGELVLAPRRHQSSFPAIGDAAIASMSSALLDAVHRIDAAFDKPPYNLVLQTWPRGRQDDPGLHWYLRIIPRIAVVGGFELSTGESVVTLRQEDAAQQYRAAGRK